MDNGWIKIGRRLAEWSGWHDGPYDVAHSLMDLLLLINRGESRLVRTGRGEVVCERGQYVTNERRLARRWQVSQRQVQRRLRQYQEAGFIDVDASQGITIITALDTPRKKRGESRSESRFEPRNESKNQRITFGASSTYIPHGNGSGAGSESSFESKSESSPLKYIYNNKQELKNNKNLKKQDKNIILGQYLSKDFKNCKEELIKQFVNLPEIRDYAERLRSETGLTISGLQAIAQQCVKEWGEYVDGDPRKEYTGRHLLNHVRKKIQMRDYPTGAATAGVLGPGERIDQVTGMRTYGPGTVSVPMDAPPRPDLGHWYNPLTGRWQNF